MSGFSNGNGFGFNGNGHNNNGEVTPGDGFEEDEDHEHTYVNIIQTPNVAAYEEMIHQVVTLEFHDRGLTMDFNIEEAEELGRVLAEVMAYLKRKGPIEPQ